MIPPTRSSASIGSRSTSTAIRKGVRRSGCGSSLYPSAFSRAWASTSVSPGSKGGDSEAAALDLMLGSTLCAWWMAPRASKALTRWSLRRDDYTDRVDARAATDHGESVNELRSCFTRLICSLFIQSDFQHPPLACFLLASDAAWPRLSPFHLD